ncbi:hypothetical protein F5I97DRAFT_1850328 [Phlebopus sp. FC_14]|nr:hypothetical protein F5I97DRAFT_1850328 [Phlebopus sp. FC_14]
MTKSKHRLDASPPSKLKERKSKIFYEHGKDGLDLALSIAKMQEDKALQKMNKYHQQQDGKPRSERRDRVGDKKKRLDDTKAMIAKQRAQSKKEKAKSRKESKKQLGRREDPSSNTSGSVKDSAPRKRVSFV